MKSRGQLVGGCYCVASTRNDSDPLTYLRLLDVLGVQLDYTSDLLSMISDI